MRTGWEAVKLAKALYIIPFVFAFGSLLDDSIGEILFDTAALLGAFACMPLAMEGFLANRLNVRERVCFGAIAACLVAATFGSVGEAWPWLIPTAVLCAIVSVSGFRRRLAPASLGSDESPL